jgi:hypothetical protein
MTMTGQRFSGPVFRRDGAASLLIVRQVYLPGLAVVKTRGRQTAGAA